MALKTLVDGLAFAEGLRWHKDQLWFSDMHDGSVWRVSEDGTRHQVCKVAGRPSGLGWLPNGDLLVVSMMDKKILRLDEAGKLSEHADISTVAPRRANDMVVDKSGRAYIGNFGFDFEEGEPQAATPLAVVEPDGKVSATADELIFPNGMVITADGKVLVVAETFATCLTAFDIAADGTLSNRRVWAELGGGAVPDGICMDGKGAIWVASPTTGECLRVVEGGEVTARVETGRQAIACALGGASGDVLFIATSGTVARDECRSLRSARIEYVVTPK